MAIDQTLEVVDAVWLYGKGKDTYKEARMANLLNLFSSVIGGRIQAELPDEEIWNIKNFDAKAKVNECLRAARTWVDGLDRLTQEKWLDKNSTHQWKGERYNNKFMNNLKKRLEEVLEIRTQVPY